MNIKSIGFINGNTLKIIAAVAMLIDHTGMLIFPTNITLRCIGRISFPIFAFFIAEGCHYTKNIWLHLIRISSIAAIFQIVYFLYSDNGDMSVLATFAFSIFLIIILQNLKNAIKDENKSILKIAFLTLGFITFILSCYIFCRYITVDYGFWGILTPVFAALFYPSDRKSKIFHPICIAAMSIPLAVLCIGTEIQIYSFIAILPLAFYNGKRGKYKMKNFFYIFYPAHLVILEGISLLLYS